MTLTVVNLPPGLTAVLREALTALAGDTEICVAGTGPVVPRAFLDVSSDAWAGEIAALEATCFAAQATARAAIAAGRSGRVVYVVHPSAQRAVAGASTSAITGAFLSTFAQVGGIELAERDVTCNTVIAGWTEESAPADVTAAIPAGRLAGNEDIAAAVAYLASPAARFVTGASLAVDGGFVVTKVGGGSPLLPGIRT